MDFQLSLYKHNTYNPPIFFSSTIQNIRNRCQNQAVTSRGMPYANKILSSWSPEMGGLFKPGQKSPCNI